MKSTEQLIRFPSLLTTRSGTDPSYEDLDVFLGFKWYRYIAQGAEITYIGGKKYFDVKYSYHGPCEDYDEYDT